MFRFDNKIIITHMSICQLKLSFYSQVIYLNNTLLTILNRTDNTSAIAPGTPFLEVKHTKIKIKIFKFIFSK